MNETLMLLDERDILFAQHDQLLNLTSLNKATRAAELLCHLTTYPEPMWSYWAAFDFCVSVITTVG